MPRFELNKLVRDKLRDEYGCMEQIAVYKELSPEEHKTYLIKKIIEEALEIETDKPVDEIINEIADLQQVIDDLAVICNITKDQISFAQKHRYDLKGGFSGGVFVETLELKDDDLWVEYYRKRPDVFIEEK